MKCGITILGHRDTGAEGVREVHKKCTRGALMGTNFILTHLGHGWDTGTLAPNVQGRCTRGASLNLPLTVFLHLLDIVFDIVLI